MEDIKRLEKCFTHLIPWYECHARVLPWRENKDPYHVWLSEIMLQQTRVEAVKGYYKRFLDALPTVQSLADAKEDTLLKLWEGLGYYNRVRNMQKAARTICEKHQGEFPKSYEDIHALSGIGDYTAGAIGSICFDLCTPAVDGNVLRVYSRLFADATNIDMQSTKRMVTQKLAQAYPKEHPGKATQALMELGATVCVPNGAPKCEQCPLAGFCEVCKKGSWKDYPVRKEKKARMIVDKTVFVLRCEDRYAICRREDKGLLASMWQFPNIDEKMTVKKAMKHLEELGIEVRQPEMQQEYTHIFSHVEWRMTAYYLSCYNQLEDYAWASREELEQIYALPSAFRPFMEALGEET